MASLLTKQMMKTRFSPSLLTWLRCFEAVARCGSFTRAAQELHITQGAVSQQIKQLEGWLEVPVLQRLPREVLLTAEGERLRCVVSDAFRCMDTVIGEIRQERISAPMEMICAPSFAMRWLMPRMGDFFDAILISLYACRPKCSPLTTSTLLANTSTP